MMEQPESLRKTFESEFSKIDEASQLVSDVDKVYLIGCGSSISTCYSVRDAIRMSSTNINIEVYTGYEFYYNKKLQDGENSIAIFTSQSVKHPIPLLPLEGPMKLEFRQFPLQTNLTVQWPRKQK